MIYRLELPMSRTNTHDLYMPKDKGRELHKGKMLTVTKKLSTLQSFVVSFRGILLNSNLNSILYIYIFFSCM